ncbi:DNA replication/repair protein RecF [Carnobacteriaceae bacterium zg-ZUI240]|nr:DNA replication/repair protein RecF [Carnobacteriaceae bacterium zg-ZUI240]
MYVEQLSLSHFRNYTKQTVEFSPKINIMIGENAQGKTNLIEALHVLALTKSHRTHNDKDLIQFQQEFTKIDALITKQNKIPLQLIIHHKGKKASIGKIEQKKLSDYVGFLKVVVFAPEDLDIIKGTPAIRRKFIDMQLGQMNKLYLNYLSTYQKTLKQRNTYLKEAQLDTVYFDILTEELAKLSAIILHYRLAYIQQITHYASTINLSISQQKDALSIAYISQLDNVTDTSIDKLEQKFMQLYHNNKEKELYQRKTLYGIHRDDVIFYVNGKNVHDFGSQGQQRTVALSVKLAEIDSIFDQTGEYPILLLDDVLSELDDLRQTYLLKTVENKVQTFITTTNLEGIQKHLIEQPKIFHIKEGSVTYD